MRLRASGILALFKIKQIYIKLFQEITKLEKTFLDKIQQLFVLADYLYHVHTYNTK